jgi:adenosine deaminase
MRAGLICIAVRDFGQEEVDRTVDFFLKHQDSLIGLDLAGNESLYPCRLFESSFKKAIKKNAKITIHAGEASGPDSMWEAIELLGAQRIGHGIRCVEDPQLVTFLADRKLCLEICPTSNWLTQATASWETHPLTQIIRAGIPACINTDDPGIFGVTLKNELEICRTRLGMTSEELEACSQSANQASFL